MCSLTCDTDKEQKKNELFAWEEVMKKDFLFTRELNQNQMLEDIMKSTAEK